MYVISLEIACRACMFWNVFRRLERRSHSDFLTFLSSEIWTTSELKICGKVFLRTREGRRGRKFFVLCLNFSSKEQWVWCSSNMFIFHLCVIYCVCLNASFCKSHHLFWNTWALQKGLRCVRYRLYTCTYRYYSPPTKISSDILYKTFTVLYILGWYQRQMIIIQRINRWKKRNGIDRRATMSWKQSARWKRPGERGLTEASVKQLGGRRRHLSGTVQHLAGTQPWSASRW